MESWFLVFAGASLFATWISTAKLVDLHAPPPCGGQAVLQVAAVAPFGRVERDWRVYEPQIARTIGTSCAADTKAFAASLADWQRRHHLAAGGGVNTPTLAVMKQTWQGARPFIAGFDHGACPAAASDDRLVDIAPHEGWQGKRAKLDARALAALRRMVEAARADRAIAADKHALTIVSAFRSPAYDAARCAKGANCNGIAIARCSAHRTGTAVDLYVGAAPGHSPVDSDDANRLYQSRTPVYRWLVKNASRFGFVNYAFEPWHWEWTGAVAPAPRLTAASPRPIAARLLP